MASNEIVLNRQPSNICLQCGKQVEVFNQDAVFSMDLHMQSHKSLDYVAAICNQPYDFKYSDTNIGTTLDEIFKNIPKSLQSHRDLLVINNEAKAVCSVCDFVVHDYPLLIPHLKSANHESQIITHLKKLIPSTELRTNLIYISFRKSNLGCSLCNCNIKMNTANMFETILNIFLHNTLPEHVTKLNISKKEDEAKNVTADKLEGDIVLSELTKQVATLSMTSSSIEENQIETTPKTDFDLTALLNSLPGNLKHVRCLSTTEEGCIACNICCCKLPPTCYNLETHLKGNAHKKKLLKSLLDGLQPQHQEETCLTVYNDLNILCSTCTCIVTPNIRNLQQHLNGSNHKKNALQLLLPRELYHLTCLTLTEPRKLMCTVCNCQVRPSSIRQHLQEENHKRNLLLSLISSLPAKYKNVSFITVTNSSQIQCSICNIALGCNTSVLKNHLKQNHTSKKKIKTLNLSNFLPYIEHCSSLLLTDNDKRVMCSVCMVKISLSEINIAEHFKGAKHMAHVKRKTIAKTQETITK